MNVASTTLLKSSREVQIIKKLPFKKPLSNLLLLSLALTLHEHDDMKKDQLFSHIVISILLYSCYMVNLFTPSTYRHELRVFYICVTLLLCHCVAYIVRVLSVVETPGCHFYTNRLYKAGVITVSQTNHERAQPVYSRRKDQIFSSFAT